MTLAEFVQNYSGQRVRGGQCGELVRQYWIDVDKTNPPSYVNSKDYWSNPVPGYDKVSSPQPGDIAIYDGHGSFTEGHSAIYVGNGQVFEQNADPDGSPAHLFKRPNTYLLGYLRKEGGEPMFNEGDRININNYLYGGDIGEHKDAVGADWKTAMYRILGSNAFTGHQRVNSGDVFNLKGWGVDSQAADNAKGKLWKNAVYEDFRGSFGGTGGGAQTKLDQIKQIVNS